MILSAASADNFEIIYKQKSIITAFKEAGFKTAFLSNQVPNNTFTDFFSREADVVKFLRGDPLAISNNPLDHDLLPLLDNFIAKGGNKQFIVLHTYGSHFNYCDRHPTNSGHIPLLRHMCWEHGHHKNHKGKTRCRSKQYAYK